MGDETGQTNPGLTNPFDGRPGFWNRINRALYPVVGPAQLGAGAPETPYALPTDSLCPVCGAPLADHDIRRGDANTASRLNCPR